MNGVTQKDGCAAEQCAPEELQQVGVLPWRIRKNGDARILLITSRRSGRWIVPKGWPGKGLAPRVAASREALEEGGVIGVISKAPVTTYRYMKCLDDGSRVACRVAVFGMNVRGTLVDWREKGQRTRRWFSLAAAADKLDDRELATFLRSLSAASERSESPTDLIGQTSPLDEILMLRR
ncbi:NUDIX hydrolase [Ensifer sp. 2YAB10]|uniref:NUDIX hydrolase n=1 Tax=unclassified Ensifer TaxID=2633371 RepID=UPI000DE491F9